MDLDVGQLDAFRQEVKEGIERRVLALIRGEAGTRELLRREP